MSNVIDFDMARKGGDTTERFLNGTARCARCKHEWEAVTPVGEIDGLECPECHLFMGVLKGPVAPDWVWQCNCGSDLFCLTRQGAVCQQCGLYADGWADG